MALIVGLIDKNAVELVLLLLLVMHLSVNLTEFIFDPVQVFLPFDVPIDESLLNNPLEFFLLLVVGILHGHHHFTQIVGL